MEVLVFMCVTGIVALAYFLVFLPKRRQSQQRNILKSLEIVMSLKELLILLQQHRGLTTGFLHGDAQLERSIGNKRASIDEKWKALDAASNELESDMLYTSIKSHWERLATGWQRQTVANNIDQHSRLITNLLYMIENQAENYGPMLRLGRDSGLDVIWKELLEAIEAIGQTRAIGMGVVSAGESSVIERIQLKFLVDKVKHRVAALESSFTKKTSLMGNKKWASLFLNDAQLHVEQLLSFVESMLLNNDLKSVTSETFFDLASSAITPLDKLFVEAEEKIKDHLKISPMLN
ncbi:MAG: nitrate- and nitrite sensing domain-containing protein [Oleiphilaceae bacterium]|nr:nitrate- and nitrite sensing domain-containing protein [Oleiphilaceae bacterium]